MRSVPMYAVPMCVVLVLGLLAGVGCKGDIIPSDPNRIVDEDIGIIAECGGSICDLEAGERCCFTGTKRDRCAMSCDEGQLLCDGPEDCAEGQMCCGDLDGSTCVDQCDLAVCHDSADCASLEKTPVCRESTFVEMNYCKAK